MSKRYSQKWKDKISKTLTGRKLLPFTEEHKIQIGLSNLGKHSEKRGPFTEEHKKRISDSNIGKIFTEKHKENIRKAKKGKTLGKNNPNFGNHKLAGENNPNYKDGLGACRGYANHKISFEHPGCVWHHVNMMFVVACPEEIHKKCNHHILGSGKSAGIHGHFLEGVLG